MKTCRKGLHQYEGVQCVECAKDHRKIYTAKNAEKIAASKKAHTRRNAKRIALYYVWSAMKHRCLNKDDPYWSDYGGRGITVDAAWMSFTRFCEDMGERPSGMSLERVDNNKGYNNENCVWAPQEAQCRNKRSNVWVSAGGVRMVLTDAVAALGISAGCVYYYKRTKGFTTKEAVEYVYERKYHKKESL